MKSSIGAFSALSAAVVFSVAVGCSGDFPTDTKPTAVGVVQVTAFELVPVARTCPAVTPLTFNGLGPLGDPAVFNVNFEMDVANTKSHDVTIQEIKSSGVVTGATNDLGLGLPANVGVPATIATALVVPAKNALHVSGSFVFLCGVNPNVRNVVFWDIATRLTVTTSDGAIQSEPVIFRRSWDRCGQPLDPGHPCPPTQPPPPTN